MSGDGEKSDTDGRWAGHCRPSLDLQRRLHPTGQVDESTWQVERSVWPVRDQNHTWAILPSRPTLWWSTPRPRKPRYHIKSRELLVLSETTLCHWFPSSSTKMVLFPLARVYLTCKKAMLYDRPVVNHFNWKPQRRSGTIQTFLQKILVKKGEVVFK